jgi:iron(III) transport system permease protein
MPNSSGYLEPVQSIAKADLSVLEGEFGTAAALSTILLVASDAAVYAVFRPSGRNESAFV